MVYDIEYYTNKTILKTIEASSGNSIYVCRKNSRQSTNWLADKRYYAARFPMPIKKDTIKQIGAVAGFIYNISDSKKLVDISLAEPLAEKKIYTLIIKTNLNDKLKIKINNTFIIEDDNLIIAPDGTRIKHILIPRNFDMAGANKIEIFAKTVESIEAEEKIEVKIYDGYVTL